MTTTANANATATALVTVLVAEGSVYGDFLLLVGDRRHDHDGLSAGRSAGSTRHARPSR